MWFQNCISKRNRFVIQSLVAVCKWFHKTWTPQNFMKFFLLFWSWKEGELWLSLGVFCSCLGIVNRWASYKLFQIKHGICFSCWMALGLGRPSNKALYLNAPAIRKGPLLSRGCRWLILSTWIRTEGAYRKRQLRKPIFRIYTFSV